MLKNFKLTIEYDGTFYHGWQRQKNHRTIQGEIEKAIRTMTSQKVRLIGSGRTDAGVHAYAQVANFRCDTQLETTPFLNGLNSLTDPDIVIKKCEVAPEAFHAQYDAKRKIYVYRLLNRSIPAAISRQYAWFVRKKLDMHAMQQAMGHIIGSHDFKAFEASGSPRVSTVRHVMRMELRPTEEGYLIFEIEANGFLKFMVRNIVGTLVSIGLGKLTPADMRCILLCKNRSQAAGTAPPHGLFLKSVVY
jgi:tRNA pseudouridine38-40 synthase